MRQHPCPECGAPMWEGGSCPWSREGQCRGRSLVSAPRKRLQTAVVQQVASVPTPKPVAEWQPQRPRLEPGQAQARKRARSDAYNKAHRATVVAMCVQCGETIPVHHGGPRRRYCSPRCRGRYERASRAA